MRTLLDLLPTMQRLGGREAMRFCNGFRTWKLSYRQLYDKIGAFAAYLNQQDLQKGDRVLLWGENRIEWVIVFWGCLVRGIQVVPVDARFSHGLVKRIQDEVKARLLVHDDTVETDPIELRKLLFSELDDLPKTGSIRVQDVSPSDIVQIVYTSGTTALPKGVVHRHKNICSHMYGQSLGMFIPLLLGGSAVFMVELNPAAIMNTIRREKVSVLVAVPRLVKNLQNQMERRWDLPEEKVLGRGILGLANRWWRYREVHAALGWKFWSIVVGGAQLDPRSETFWKKLGFLVLQGYGLTETSPVVTVNHPFHTRQGSIGRALKGQEVKIAPDGEILVRGESVVSEYLGEAGETRVLDDGWLHTGDLGEMDPEGNLYYKGRKKDVIVTSEGLNVYPQDVESVLSSFPQIHDSAVIGLQKAGEETVHAVLIPKNDALDIDRLISQANQNLEAHQRIGSWSIWPEEEFPRTASTLKIKRRQIAQSVQAAQEGKTAVPPKTGTGDLESILSQLTGKNPSELEKDRRLGEDLGLSSLQQVDLLSQLENRVGLDLDEEQFTGLSTIEELKTWLKEERQEAALRMGPKRITPAFPHWSQLLLVRWIRNLALGGFILPLFRHYVRLNVEGLEHLTKVDPPVIFVANHVSHLDTVAISAALPSSWRRRLAPAMAQDFFRAYFQPLGRPWKERVTSTSQYLLACGLFNAYPLPQGRPSVRRALKYTGQRIDQGHCPLVYPEGRRSPDGNLQPFQTGIGFMALRLQVPVVPIHLEGLYQIYSIHHEWPQSGEVQVKIGSALSFRGGQDYEKVTREVEEALRRLKGSA
jgi:long-chain acyl-CoA synthetase